MVSAWNPVGNNVYLLLNCFFNFFAIANVPSNHPISSSCNTCLDLSIGGRVVLWDLLRPWSRVSLYIRRWEWKGGPKGSQDSLTQRRGHGCYRAIKPMCPLHLEPTSLRQGDPSFTCVHILLLVVVLGRIKSSCSQLSCLLPSGQGPSSVTVTISCIFTTFSLCWFLP